MNLTHKNVLEYGLEPTAKVLTRGFSGYFVPIQISPAGIASMVQQDSVDPGLSRVIFHDDQPVGVALIARRGWTSRLAAMSIVPDARGRGIGSVCVAQLLAQARARGDKAMVLEVIEQNDPAVALYKKCGFEINRRLVGFVGALNVESSDLATTPADVREAARALIAHGPADLPWQESGETLAQMGPPNIAYASDSTFLVLSNPDAPTVLFRSIVTLPHARRRGAATALLRAAVAKYPGKTWRVAAHCPEEIADLFLKLGLEKDTISQWQMTAIL